MSDDYWRLSALVDEVVEQAIYAELRVYGWYPDDQGGVSYFAGGLGGGYSPSVARPGNGYPADPVSPNAGYVDPEGGYTDGTPSLGDIYRSWESKIPPIFEAFHDLPHPGLFQDLADDVRLALMQLSTEGHTGSGSGEEDAANVDYPGNTTLGLAHQVAQTLNTWQGGAATSFATYLNVFREVVGNQALACEVLRATLFMEMEMFARLRNDVVNLAHDAAEAFRGCGGFGGGDIKAILSVAGTVNSILGWFPALAPATGAAGKALTVGNVLVDTLGGGDPPENELSDFHFNDVLSKLQNAAEDLKGTTKTVEGDIEQSLRNLETLITTAPPARSDGTQDQDSFRLARPSETYGATSTTDFVYPDVVVNPDNVYDAASLLEDDLAAEMMTAATSLDSANSSGPWHRNGEIGTSPLGAWNEYFSASFVLEREIEETAKEMKWAAQMLRAVADDLANTDNDVRDDFAGVRGRIDRHDNPVYTGPTYDYPPSKPLPEGPY